MHRTLRRRAHSQIIILFLLSISTNSQKIEFDEHYYNNRRTPTPLFNNGTFKTDGNVTEYYNPLIYAPNSQNNQVNNQNNQYNNQNNQNNGSNLRDKSYAISNENNGSSYRSTSDSFSNFNYNQNLNNQPSSSVVTSNQNSYNNLNSNQNNYPYDSNQNLNQFNPSYSQNNQNLNSNQGPGSFNSNYNQNSASATYPLNNIYNQNNLNSQNNQNVFNSGPNSNFNQNLPNYNQQSVNKSPFGIINSITSSSSPLDLNNEPLRHDSNYRNLNIPLNPDPLPNFPISRNQNIPFSNLNNNLSATSRNNAQIRRNFETDADWRALNSGNFQNSNFPNSPNFGNTNANYQNLNYGNPNYGNSGTNRIYNTGGRNYFDPGEPNRNIWNEEWSTTTIRPGPPGVLGRWRPDLQGKQRPDDLYRPPQTVFVTSPYGRVQGFKVRLYDGPGVPPPARPGGSSIDKPKSEICSFVGIPYARPPVGEARFRPPRSHPGWQVLQATEFAPACPQPSRFFGHSAGIVQVSEDCLYLNVYSPDVGSGAESAPYPVLFYIHDGDFTHGASQTFPPHQLVSAHKVVVVTVNYRLGALGFLSTADEFSPGNYGMLDLGLALKWTHSAIRAFNGDPNRITLLGLGSGAAAAGLLMLSPKSRHLVKNVIALGGAPTADWGAIDDKYRVQNTTQLFSLKQGCWNEWGSSSWNMVQCLKARSWQEIANLELDPDVGIFPWSPVVDRTFTTPLNSIDPEWAPENWHFLPDSPLALLRSSQYPPVKYLTGSSRQAAADLLYENKTLGPGYGVTREWFDERIKEWVKKYNYTLNPEGVFSAIRYAYTYWPDPFNVTHLREEYIQFLSDALYRAPIDQTVKLLLSRGLQVHSYILNYTLEGLHLPEWRETPRYLEYYLLAGAPFMDSEFIPERLRVERSAWSEGDRNMSQFLMECVGNMAHHGSPTPRQVLGIYWERATPADLKYLVLNGTNNSTMGRNYRQRELTFWTEYLPFVVGRFVPTYPPTTEYWWEPNEPLQIAFWSVSALCLVLIVILVACFLLWRTAKKQRDRIYADYGPGNPPLGVGPLIGGPNDELLSEYAASVKTADSLDSGVKLSSHPNPHIPSNRGQKGKLGHFEEMPLYNTGSIKFNPAAVSHPSLVGAGGGGRDRYPVPRRAISRNLHDTSQTQV